MYDAPGDCPVCGMALVPVAGGEDKDNSAYQKLKRKFWIAVIFTLPVFLISMSDMKYNAIVNTGIKIVNRVEIPPELVPPDAQVEITAKVFHGYNAGDAYKDIDEKKLKETKGSDYDYEGKEEAKK